MFCVMYKFTVRPGCENRFRQSWSAVTQYLYRHCGSLGSRLHTAYPGEYIAYAQWPSRAAWKQQAENSDAALQEARQAMRDACMAIDVLYELETTDDYLQREVASPRV